MLAARLKFGRRSGWGRRPRWIPMLVVAALLVAAGGLVVVSPVVTPAPAGASPPAQTTLLTLGVYYPRAVAVDSAGSVYVADSSHARVLKRTSSGVVTTVGFTGLSDPWGVAVDGAGTVFVTSGNNVLKRTTGGVQTTLGFTGLDGPGALAVDHDGNVYVADAFNNRIVELSSGGTQTTLAFSGLSYPRGVAVDADENVYVADTSNSRIVELPKGGSQTTLGFNSLNGPTAVAANNDGDLWVADSNNNRIVSLPKGGSQTGVAITGLFVTFGVAVDAAGNVYATDFQHDRVVELPNGGVETPLVFGDLSRPDGVAVDAEGNAYAPDARTGRVFEVANGGPKTLLPFSGVSYPEGIAVDTAGDVFVTQGSGVVSKLTKGGTQTDISSSMLGSPALAVNGAGDIYLYGDHYFQGEHWQVEMRPAGGGSWTVLPFGNLNTSIAGNGIAVDSAGSVYISFGSSVLKLTTAGVQSTLGFTGLGVAGGVAVDSVGNVYVTDGDHERVVKLTPGGVQTTVGFTGLHWPTAVAVDTHGSVFVTAEGSNGALIELSLVAPGAPTIGAVTPGNGQATVSWTAPASDGGSAVTGYVVTPYIGATAQAPRTFNSTATTQSVTGLTNGTAYTFKVAATNAAGTGSQSAASALVTPRTVPGAPTIGTVTPGNGQATVSWTAPASDGGSAITGYVVTPYIGSTAQAPRTFNSTATTQIVTGLTNGTAYTFKVAAMNAAGTGSQSAASAPATPRTVPGAPTVGVVTGGNTRATVSWTAPASNGGSAVTGYVVTPYLGPTAQAPRTFNSTATSQAVTGLANGTVYTFRVAAMNAAGTGSPSALSSQALPPFASRTAFTRRQYTDVMNRAATGAEVTNEINALNAGAAPGALVLSLRRSSDATTHVDPVTRLYFAYFLRIPDKGGLTYWIAQQRAGKSLWAISDFFASSAEFKSRYGSLSNAAFVALVYQNVLGRGPDAGGLSYWTSQLASGAKTRGQVMVGFSESPEYRGKMQPSVDVAVTWIDLLGASPGTTDFNTWVTNLTTGGKTVTDLAGAIMAMPAYATRVA